MPRPHLSRTRTASVPILFGPLPVETDAGCFWAWYSEAGLRALTFPRDKPAATHAVSPAPRLIRAWHRSTVAAVRTALTGRVPRRLPPLDWAGQSAFHRAVWRQLLRIPPGQVRTYGQVARDLGRPGAARAVGRACAANPIPLLVPCHRVVASGGRPGGFSAGLEWKRRLLAGEGVEMPGGRPLGSPPRAVWRCS